MMTQRNNLGGIPQLLLRLALGLGFLIPVCDRLGWLGRSGSAWVSWGDWQHFIAYTHSLLPFLNVQLSAAAGMLASVAEAVFGICLIVGFQLRYAAFGCAALTFTFAVCMASSQGISAPFKYPVFLFTAAALVLSDLPAFRWSLDQYMNKTQLR